jgi:dTDP-4-dehydrorhamnose reductase
MSKRSILVLGSASWLGSLMISKLDATKFDISATYFNTFLNFGKPLDLYEAKLISDYNTFLNSIQPEIIVNFLRSDNDIDLKIHEKIINYCRENKSTHYIFCSSVLALDAYENEDLTESLVAKSKSDYGIYKSRCEQMLYDEKFMFSILRFASLQGYCKHKTIRNEYLLKQLKIGETIRVDQKVIQNRMFADDAVDIMLRIIELKATGIIHLGTTDASDEIDFLRKQALHYGYDSDRILPKHNIRNANLNCIPAKIHSISPKSRLYTEEDTLNKIFNIEAYHRYKKSYGN